MKTRTAGSETGVRNFLDRAALSKPVASHKGGCYLATVLRHPAAIDKPSLAPPTSGHRQSDDDGGHDDGQKRQQQNA